MADSKTETGSTPGAIKSVPLRKIVAMVGVAIFFFLAISIYQIVKSVESKDSLRNVEQVYFPVLIKADSSIAVMEKVSDEYTKAVMTAAADKSTAAHELGLGAVRNLEEMARLFPERAKEIDQVRTQFNAYNEEAVRMDDDYVNHRIVLRLWLPRMQEMNANLAATRGKLKELRARIYDDFSRSVAKTRSAMQWNLALSLALGTMNICFMGVLVVLIRNNLRMMAQISDQNANLERRVAERTMQLARKTNDIQAMLQNMPQGVLTVLEGNRIHPEYSAYLETTFETADIAGRDVMDLVFAHSDLGSDALSQVETAIAACIGEDAMNFEFNSHLLVSECRRTMADGRVKSLELGWSPICDADQVVEKLMLCVRDVTELKQLAREASAQRRELEMIGEILGVSQEKFQDFIDSSVKFVAQNETIIRRALAKDMDKIALLFRNMHTIKGNARTYGLLQVTNAVHEAEQAYDVLRKDEASPWEPESMLAQLGEVRSLIDEYAKINDSTLGRRGPGRRGNVERFLMVDKDRIAEALQVVETADPADLASLRAALARVGRTLDLIGTEKVDEVLSGVIESMPSLARELGKEPPQVTIAAHDVVVRTQVAGLLRNVFAHLFRNAMDHGLEPAAARQAAGKGPAGHIHLEVGLERGQLLFRLRDDGRGLAIAKIRRRALDIGALADPDAPADHVAQLIFVAGFSTADAVTEVSGRGVGMDAVRDFLEREGGKVEIRFLDDRADADFRAFEIVVGLPGKFGVAAGGGAALLPSS
jgi:signal transduction histidine kinase/PAS domain-containing protein